jgi:hypothetical protein
MAESELTHVEVVAILVVDRDGRVFLVFDDDWGTFGLPTTRRRQGRQGKERAPRAALRAAAAALGVPVRLVEEGPSQHTDRIESARQLVDKMYHYDLFRVEPHPDFAGRLQIRRPHLWLSPHLVRSGVYEPISETARLLIGRAIKGLEIPARIQRTSVLVLQRENPERGRQFLVRWDPDWGYALQSKRWAPAGSAEPVADAALAAAERVAREELGLGPGEDVKLAPAQRPECTTHGLSASKRAPAFGAATDYIHRLFDAQLRHPDKLRSNRPLAWVTEHEVHHLGTAASDGEPGAPAGHPSEISMTTYEILLHLGLIAEKVGGPEEDAARLWLEERGVGRG